MDKELHEAMQRIARHCQTHICDEDCEFHDGRPGHTLCQLTEVPCAWSFTEKKVDRANTYINLNADDVAEICAKYKAGEEGACYTIKGSRLVVLALLLEILAQTMHAGDLPLAVIVEGLIMRLKGIKEEKDNG